LHYDIRTEMTINHLNQLAELISQQQETLLTQWRQQVKQLPSAQHLDTPTLNDHIPRLIEEVIIAFQSSFNETILESVTKGSPPAHGLQRVHDGFDIEEVVAEYNIMRGCIHDLAITHGINLQGEPFHILNRLLDEAIGAAVQTYAAQQALEVQRRREEYLAFVAHDLRTPLNAISLVARVLEMKLTPQNLSADTTQMLKILHRNVQHLDELISKVIKENANLVEENGVNVERREFDLWPLVESLIYDLHPLAGTANTQVRNQVPDNLVVYADASLLRRVLQNLIANAITYTAGGEIVVTARYEDLTGNVECWVSDNGAGIAKDRLDKVFDKSETDPQREDGTGLGLGLAIVKTFVEAHDGTVRVESEEGIGSTFYLTLPPRRNPATVVN
jgi:two-component system, OmpR family, phosphate regulon sensor histidine kinase PhoR